MRIDTRGTRIAGIATALIAGTLMVAACAVTPAASGATVTTQATVTGATASPVVGSSRVVYVSPTGSDSAAGTQAAPFKTPQRGVQALGSSGGTVELAGGTYAKERISLVGKSGIVIRAAAGATPVLDGTGLTIGTGQSAAIEIRDSSDIAVRGITVTGFRTATTGRVPIGILVTGGGARIALQSNHVTRMGHDGTERGSSDINAHGIAVYGTSTTTPVSDLVIDGNEVDNLVLGASESLVVNGNVSGWTISNNRVHDNNNIGIDVIGYETTIGGSARYTDVNRARNGKVVGNTVSGITADHNPAYLGDGTPCHCADGIYVDGGKDVIISDNSVTTSDIGIEVAAENPKGKTNGVLVTRNTVTRSQWVGLAMGGYAANRGEAYDVTIARNTFTDNNTLNDGSGAILIQFKVHDSSIVDNVITTNGDDPALIERVKKAGTTAQNANVTIDRNTCSAPADRSDVRFTWFGKSITGFDAWIKASGQDAHSTYTVR